MTLGASLPDVGPPPNRFGRFNRNGTLWQSTLSFRQGWKEIFKRRNIFLVTLWLASAGLAIAAVLFALGQTLAPGLFAGVSGPLSSSEPAIAALIYVFVIAIGSWHLLEGLGRTGRERTMIGQSTQCIDEFRAHSVISHAEVFGANNPFLAEGFRRISGNDQTAVYKLIDTIRRDGELGRFDPIYLMVERVSDQVLGGSSGIRDDQQLGVRLGILGTFIGILWSLNGVGGIAGSNEMKEAALQEAIHTVVGSLGGAFTTSIAGLASAIFLQVMAGSLRSRENDVIEQLHRIGAQVQSLCRLASRDGDQHELEVTLKEHRETIHGLAKDITIGADKVGQAVDAVSRSLDTPLRAIQEQGASLDAALRAQSEAVAHLAGIAGTMRALEERIGAAQSQTMGRFAATVEALTGRLVAEIQTGYGREAREDFERHIDQSAARQYQAVASMARNFRWTMIFAGLTLTTVIVAAGGIVFLFHRS